MSGQRWVTVLMLVVCAAVGVAIAGVPHRSSEPAIRLTDQTTQTSADPVLAAVVDDATTTSTAPTTTTTATTVPARTTTTKANRTATTAASKPVVATTVAKPATVVTPTGLNPDGR